MTGQPGPPPRGQRPKAKDPKERAQEFAAAQRQLKAEAAERRDAAAATPPPKKRG